MGTVTVNEAPRKAGPLQVAKAVFWSFFGIRRRAEHEADVKQLTPVQVIVAGLIGAALFVATLVLIVRFVIGQAAG
jgi:diacylglycerol kinase